MIPEHIHNSDEQRLLSELSISSDDSRKLSEMLQKGQAVKSTIISNLSPNKALLRIEGLRIVAQSDIAFPERGESLDLVVTSLRPKLVFGLLEQEGQLQITQNIRENELKDVLHDMGFASTKENLQIAKNLVKYGMSLTKEGVDSVLAYMDKFQLSDKQSVEAIIFLVSRSLPVNKENVELIGHLLLRNPDFGKIIQQLTDLTSAGIEPITKSEELLNVLRILRGLELNLQDPNLLTSQLKESVQNIWASIESRIVHIGDLSGGEESLLLSELSRHINTQLYKIFQSDQWAEILKEPVLSKEAESLIDILARVSDYAESRQLANSSDTGSNTKTFILDFPHDISRQIKHVLLEIDLNEDANKEKQGANQSSHVSFSLGTSNLGFVRISMDLVGNNVGATAFLADEPTCDYVGGNKNELASALEGKGFKLGRFDCRVVAPKLEEIGQLAAHKDIISIDKIDVII